MKVVAIHGIGQTYVGGPQIETQWLAALSSGLTEAGAPRLKAEEFKAVGYGAVFRPSGQRGGPEPDVRDLDAWEQEMLLAWWREAAALSAKNRGAGPDNPRGEDPTLQGEDFTGRARVPMLVQRALDQVARARFFRALGGRRVLLFGLRQVRLFLHDAKIKRTILERVKKDVAPDTRVLIGHSLGSIVAYEALCMNSDNSDWQIDTFVTLGSPLGIPELVYDQLTPRPQAGQGTWPNVRRWVNIADEGDIVALVKKLAPLFPAPAGSDLEDFRIYNGWESHSAERYLSARETGRVIADGLTT
jgi:hypothetical protein